VTHMKGRRAVTTVYLRPGVLKALQRLSKRKDMAMAQFLREAVDDLLIKHGAKVANPRTRK
jgi:hypothetical protein